MPQYFVICTDSTESGENAVTERERNRITRLLHAKGWHVWHWFEDVWLTVNPTDQYYSAYDLNHELREKIEDERYILVMQVAPMDHAGFGPSRGWTWTNKFWPGGSD
jgi:hypothetical protein